MTDQRRYHAPVLHSQKHHESETEAVLPTLIILWESFAAHDVAERKGTAISPWMRARSLSVGQKAQDGLSDGVNGPSRRPAKRWCRNLGSGVVDRRQKMLGCALSGSVKVLWLSTKCIKGTQWLLCHERRVMFGKNISAPDSTVTAILPGSKWSLLLFVNRFAKRNEQFLSLSRAQG